LASNRWCRLGIAITFLYLKSPPRIEAVTPLSLSGVFDVDAFISRDREFIFNVQKALEQAFVVRARQLLELRAED
jgi:hypothetical protein